MVEELIDIQSDMTNSEYVRQRANVLMLKIVDAKLKLKVVEKDAKYLISVVNNNGCDAIESDI